MALEVGRVCMKLVGREAGRLCVVLNNITNEKTKKNSFVMVTGPRLLTGIKRRKANITHLEPTRHILEIKEDATDEEIIEAYKKANVVTKFNLKLPSAGKMKAVKEEKVKEAETKPKEKAEVKKMDK
ncbi:MAG: 50S ribosomal protein L14e [Candidatus Aenigmarchaeota archaeon]|nr:50S ribosomal protein L14e [Candidatus Aenigmarchaeota archaeon]